MATNWYRNNSTSTKNNNGSTTDSQNWLGSWFNNKKTASTPATSTPTTTTAQSYTQTATPLTTQQVSDWYRSMPSYMPSYTAKTPDQLKQQAKIDTSLVYDPQISALQRAYEQQAAEYQNQINNTKANYGNVESSVNAAMQAAERRALDQAIAMGGGMSGMPTWLTNEAYKTILPELTQAKTQQATELGNIANNLQLALKQYGQQQQDLTAQRANAELARITELEDSGYEKSLDNYQLMLDTMGDLYNIDWDKEKFAIEQDLQKKGISAANASAAAERSIQQQKIALAQQELEHNITMDTASMTGYLNGQATMDREQMAYDQLNAMAEQLGYYPLVGTTGTTV